jgi:CIC family chloride channel protein
LVSHYLIGPLDIFSIGDLSLVVFSTDLFFACFALVVLIVLLSALFLHTQKALWRLSGLSVWVRFMSVAIATSLAAVYLPEALGSGYSSLTHLLSGDVILYSLFLLIVVKTALTAFTIGLGIPGGMIGPTFIIGGLAGVQIALIFDNDVALFALLGMAAMMAACFQAPLTALVAIIEMTHSSEAIIPALFVVVLACLLMRVFFHQESVFVERLSYIGMSSTISPFQRYLRHHTVKPVSEDIVLLPARVPLEQAKNLASSMVDYIAFESDGDWHLVHRISVLDSLQTLDLGPQLWLVFIDDIAVMDLSLTLESNIVPLIDEPSSLESMWHWFQKTDSVEVLVALSDSSFRRVSRHRLDQFLLKSD